jgi:hypothetical protein
MTDDDLERTLGRYRPRDPQPDLRARVMASAQEAQWEIPWYWGPLAAAAILALWLGVLTWRIEPERDPDRDAAIAMMTDVLGGGETARRYVELTMALDPGQEQQ